MSEALVARFDPTAIALGQIKLPILANLGYGATRGRRGGVTAITCEYGLFTDFA